MLRGNEVLLRGYGPPYTGTYFYFFCYLHILAAIPAFGKVADRWRLEPDTHFSSVLTPVLNLDIDGILLSPPSPQSAVDEGMIR